MIPVEQVNSSGKHIHIDRSDFISIIGTYVPLTGDDKSPRGYCPLCHNEAHSYRGFLLRSDTLEWHCEGCNEGGDIYHFFEKLRRISHDEARRFTDMLISNHLTHKQKPIDTASLVKFPKLRSVTAAKSKPDISTGAAPPIKSARAQQSAKKPDVAAPQEPIAAEKQPEVIETTPELVSNAPKKNTKEDFVAGLLEKFEGRNGYQGIAVIDRGEHSLLGSTMEYLVAKDIEVMDEFMKSTLPATQKEMGEYEIGVGNTLVTMEIRLKSEDLKLLWIPMDHGLYPCNILLLLERNTLDSLYLMQLKGYFKE